MIQRLPIVAGILLALLAVVACSGPEAADGQLGLPSAQAAAVPHVEVWDETADCASCHESATPDVYEDWYASKHGLNGVKCFVCHGTTDESFRASPGTGTCVSCHPDQTASMSDPFMSGKDCFTCHTNHTLMPHMAVDGGE